MGSQQESSLPFQPLPPQQINCKWWKKGYCFRGEKCYFRHDEALAGVDQDRYSPAAAKSAEAEKSVQQKFKVAQASDTPISALEPEQCAICLEIPAVYGLLLHCDHVFCLECIRNWRSSTKNRINDDPEDFDSASINNNLSGATKTCPLCRTQSDFIIPTSVFPTPPPRSKGPAPEPSSGPEDSSANPENKGPSEETSSANPTKEKIVAAYLARLKRIPCRYFEEGVKRWHDAVSQPKPPFNPVCFFANDCHYAHIHPVTNEPYIFTAAEISSLKQRQARRGSWAQNEGRGILPPMEVMEQFLAMELLSQQMLIDSAGLEDGDDGDEDDDDEDDEDEDEDEDDGWYDEYIYRSAREDDQYRDDAVETLIDFIDAMPPEDLIDGGMGNMDYDDDSLPDLF